MSLRDKIVPWEVTLRLPLAPDGLPAGMPDEYGIATLGWGVLAWGNEFLAQPDGTEAGLPWEWTKTQARIVAWWYAVDKQGQWLYRRGQIVLPKGSGKSPLAAALSCCALGAEVLFDGFDAYGEAVGRPHPSPHVQLAAVSQDQTDNTMSLVLSMLREGNAINEIEGLDLGVTRVRTRNGKLEPVTASAPSREGARLTDAILDEPHLWNTVNGGIRLASTLRRNLGKMNGRSLETTNAWTPGEESVAELTSIYADKIAEAENDGGERRGDGGLMRYHPKAVVRDLSDEPRLREALTELYRDAPWVNVDRIVNEVYDPSTHPADARRFYLNEVASADDALVTAAEWDECAVEDTLEPGDEITLGFDGSKSDDSTVLVALRVSDRFATVLGAMEKPRGPAGEGWEVDREYFDGLIASAFALYRVRGFYSDVAYFETYVDKWSNEYSSGLDVKASTNSAVGWDMRGRLSLLTVATERLVAAIQDGSLIHDGGSLLRRHVLNARRRPNRWGISFGKERKDSPNKVDAFAALQLADMARADLLAEASKKRVRTGKVW
jgi:hypothetical protein